MSDDKESGIQSSISAQLYKLRSEQRARVERQVRRRMVIVALLMAAMLLLFCVVVALLTHALEAPP
jgi:uncharacterized membrane protein